MSRLLTINDLYDPTNNWKELLPTIASLGDLYEKWKAEDTGFDRTVPVFMGDSTRRPPGIHASEINTCIRQSVYSLRQERKTASSEDVNMLMRFDVGKAVHAILQDDLEHVCGATMGVISFEDEVKIHPSMGGTAAQYNYVSSNDGVFTFCTDWGDPYIRLGLEIKTMSADEFDKANAPKAVHTQQGTLYQKCLDLPIIWYLYYNKSNSNWTRPTAPWIVPFDRNEWAKLEARSVQATRCFETGTLPDREEGIHCKWCSFSEVCNPTILKLHASYKKTAPRRFNR